MISRVVVNCIVFRIRIMSLFVFAISEKIELSPYMDFKMKLKYCCSQAIILQLCSWVVVKLLINELRETVTKLLIRDIFSYSDAFLWNNLLSEIWELKITTPFLLLFSIRRCFIRRVSQTLAIFFCWIVRRL